MSDLIAGRIALIDPLARGASGSLWRAVDRRYGAICAAKVMRHRDGADVLRFVREQTVRGAEGLGGHPHLLPPYTWVAEDDTVVLAMPLVHGGTLAGALRDHGALGPGLVAHLGAQLLDALAAMHDARWVHRDLKPANLLLDATGTAAPHLLLADFGIALHENDVRFTETGMVNGTPGFMSPEAERGLTASTAADVWAAGACLVEALAPAQPSARLSTHRRAEVLEPLESPGAGEQTRALARVLRAMLDEDPVRRPSAREALDALPRPAGSVETWSRTASGAPFQVHDQIEPITPEMTGHGLPEVPLTGPAAIATGQGTLHERISARSASEAPAAAFPRPASDADDAPPVATDSPPSGADASPVAVAEPLPHEPAPTEPTSSTRRVERAPTVQAPPAPAAAVHSAGSPASAHAVPGPVAPTPSPTTPAGQARSRALSVGLLGVSGVSLVLAVALGAFGLGLL